MSVRRLRLYRACRCSGGGAGWRLCQDAELTQSALEVRAHFLPRHRVRHEDQTNSVRGTQLLLECAPLDLRLERRAALVHGIRVLAVLHALKLARHLALLTPRIQLQATLRGRIAQERGTSLGARQAVEQRLQRAAHHALPRVGILIH